MYWIKKLSLAALLFSPAALACEAPPDASDDGDEATDSPFKTSQHALAGSVEQGFAHVINGSPNAVWTYSSSGQAVQVSKSTLFPGIYTITFQGVLAQGAWHVTAGGSANRRCVTEYRPRNAGDPAKAGVICYDANGNRADAEKFNVWYSLGTGGPAGSSTAYYAVTTSPTAWSPSVRANYNSTGGTNSVSVLATGKYRVNLPGVLRSRGTIQVNAITEGNYDNVNRHCNVAEQGDNYAIVQCYDAQGALATSGFGVTVARYRGWASEVGFIANINADGQIVSDGYTYGKRTCATPAISAVRSGDTTLVRATYLPFEGSTVNVTASAITGRYCKLGDWYAYGSGVEAQVNCYNPDGTPTFTPFSIAFGTKYLTDCFQ